MPQQAIILLAEDNPDDAALIRRAFRQAGLSNRVHVVSNGLEAKEYLKGAIEAKSSGYTIPLLISLDVNMPLADGFEVLKWVKQQPELNDIPVLIMSGCAEKPNANRASHLGANSYLVKPANFEGLVQIMGTFKTLLGTVESNCR